MRPVAEIYVRAVGEQMWSCGSGYHIGSGLILTARHVVANDRERSPNSAKLRLLGAADLMDCEVAWQGAGEVDVALLRVNHPGWVLPRSRHPVRWGRLVTSIPGTSCTGEGFPAVQQNPMKIRDIEQMRGWINPGTGVKAGLLGISVEDPPARVRTSESPWAGMSGAAVFRNDLLTAVISKDPEGFNSQRLTAVPITACVDDPAFRRLVEAAIDQPLVLEPAELDGLFIHPESATSPAQLLRAEVQTVAFRGRDRELDQLQAWCVAQAWFSAWLLVGPGGQGKTRLATELVKQLVNQGWVAGFVQADPNPGVLEALSGLKVPTMIVVDYAETRPALLATIAQAIVAPEAKVRLLLLARTSGDWRQSTAADHENLTWLPDATVLNLQALESGVAGRSAAWREAVTGLARNLGPITDISSTTWADHAVNVLAHPPDWRSGGTAQASALGIHVNALAALLTEAEPALVGASAMATLLLHERRYWRRAAAVRGLVLDNITAEGAVAANTLWAANTEGEALSIVSSVRGLRDQIEDRHYAAAHWLAGLYPAEGRFWGTLQPDRLGEYHVATQLADRPELLLAPSAVASKFQAEHALTVLTRAVPDHPHLSEAIRAVVSAAPIIFGPAAIVSALQAADPTPLLKALISLLEAPALDDEAAVRLLRNLELAVPSSTHVLRQFAVEIAASLTAVYRRLAETNADAYLPEVAGALNNLSYRLSNVGRLDEALGAVQEALALYRRLAETNADAYLPEVAGALNNLSYRLSYVGRYDEALGAAQEALALYRRLAETNADAYLPEVAGALNNLSSQLSRLRRQDEARGAVQEALVVYRRLAETNADAYLPAVAGALNNLSNYVGRLGRHDEAVAAVQESLDIYRRLAETHPDAYLPAVAAALNNLSNSLGRLRRHDEAVAAAQESLDIYRRLAETHPDACLPDVARVLNNLSTHLSYFGRVGRAVAAVQESLGIYRRLAETNPDIYLRDVAGALNNLSNYLGSLRRNDEAVTAAQEALGICRRLAETNPDIHLPKVAKALINLADQLVVSESDEAESALEEAVSIYQGLAQHRPETYLRDVALALIRLSNLRAGLGHRLEAAAASEQAVHIYRRLAQTRPDAYLPGFARALSDHCSRLSGLGWRDEAVAASKEAVASYRRLTEISPDMYLPALRGAWTALADQLVALGRNEEAAAAYQEAVTIRRRLAEASPDSHLPALPGVLAEFANRLVALGRDEEATAVYQEAVTIRRRLAEASPDSHLPALPGLLAALADQLVALGRDEEAAAAYQEAVTYIASRHNRQPPAGGPLTFSTSV